MVPIRANKWVYQPLPPIPEGGLADDIVLGEREAILNLRLRRKIQMLNQGAVIERARRAIDSRIK